MSDHIAQEILELLTDGMNEYNWDYVLEASRILERHLDRMDALAKLVEEGQKWGGYD